jgi:hypothetical protein
MASGEPIARGAALSTAVINIILMINYNIIEM